MTWDEALKGTSDKDAEIERLKNIITATEVECATLRAANATFEAGMHWRNSLITEKDAEIERLKELTKRLARWARIHADQRTVSNQDLLKLIQEAGGGYQ